MEPDALLVAELRTQFKAGATPSALVRAIAERHPDEPAIDRLVRAYFREAFLIPMLQIGREQVERIAQGGGAAVLNERTVHRMVASRQEWDVPLVEAAPRVPSWMDNLTATDEASLLRAVDLSTVPELAANWGNLDEQGQQFIARTVATARSLHEKVQVLAALAEQLQQQIHAAGIAPVQGG
jgi:hypothetical protein